MEEQLSAYVWPDNAKCVVAITVDFDGTGNEVGLGIDPVGIHSAGGYSGRRGIARQLEIFERQNIAATFFVPGFDAENNPDLVRDIAARGHEIAAHGYLHERWMVPPDEEEVLLRRSHRILTDITGAEPVGWRSPGGMKSSRTFQVLGELGYIYDSSDKDFDRPYPAIIDGEPSQSVVELPNNTSSLDDFPLYVEGAALPSEVLDLWKAEFDSLYEDTGYFLLTYHPRAGFGSGIPSRSKVIDDLLTFIKGYDSVRFVTLAELARWCLSPQHGHITTEPRVGARR